MTLAIFGFIIPFFRIIFSPALLALFVLGVGLSKIIAMVCRFFVGFFGGCRRHLAGDEDGHVLLLGNSPYFEPACGTVLKAELRKLQHLVLPIARRDPLLAGLPSPPVYILA
jgi:hypothetical protein